MMADHFVFLFINLFIKGRNLNREKAPLKEVLHKRDEKEKKEKKKHEKEKINKQNEGKE